MEESVFSQSPFGTDQSSSSSSSSSSSASGRRGKKLIFLVILLVILGLIAFGAVKFLGGAGSSTPTPTPTPTTEVLPTDTPTPTPEVSGTPTPTAKITPKTTVIPTPTKTGTTSSSVDKATGLDRADLTIVVQNGSGVAGAAKTMSDKLTGLGYNVSSVGNADTSDYAQTEIHVKTANSNFLALLKKDLGADYTIGTSASDYTGSGDALVIVGKQ